MVLFSDIVSRLSGCTSLYGRLTQSQLLGYFDVASRFVPLMDLSGRGPLQRVPSLPDNVALVLSMHTTLSLDDVFDMWNALGDIIMVATPGELITGFSDADNTLSAVGKDANLGAEIMLTSARSCQTPGCPDEGRKLGQRDRKFYDAHLYTRRRGVLPIQVATLYCRGCHTTYRPNYSVHQASDENAERIYYGGVPDALEVSQRTYVETDLMVLFRAQMALSHASAETVARIYNLGLSTDQSARPISAENVWNAFYLHALLADKMRHGQRLHLPHNCSQERRFNAALAERNVVMSGIGQPLWAHACDECEHVFVPPPDASDQRWTRLNACVMDGVTIGHPRCNVKHCVEPLESPRDRFCPKHISLNQECAIDGCQNTVMKGYRTCSVPNHRHFETSMREKGRAIFQLRRRLEARAAAALERSQSVSQAADPLDDEEVFRELEGMEDPSGDEQDPAVGISSTREHRSSRGAQAGGVGPGLDVLDRPDVADVLGSDPRLHHSTPRKKKSRQPRMKTCLTRKWTHNEQLLVRPCGIVVGRASFFEAESPSNALRFVLAVFPPDLYPNSKPSFLFYDNNCKLLAHIEASGEARLRDMGMPVDVFHATSKHSDRDEFCQRHCNPAGFPELYDDKDEWIFNSSVCEQINVWFGRFLSVVREMNEVHFNFFLDEMISIHNSYKEAVLAKRGKNPRLVPLSELEISRE